MTIGLLEVIAVIWGLANKRRNVRAASPITLVVTTKDGHGGYRVPLPTTIPDGTTAHSLSTSVQGRPTQHERTIPGVPYQKPESTGSGRGLLLPETQQIHDPIILESIADGIRLRNEGDAQGALARFRSAADILNTDHPVLLSELGRTYEIMGLQKKAAACWEQIYRMGESGAGDYYVIADVRLRGLDPGTDVGSESLRLQFEGISQEVTPELAGSDQNDSGESILLRIPISRNGETPIATSEVSVYVYFYDQVNGERIEQSTADPPRSSWRTLPVDWKSLDPEIFEITYHHPTLSPEETRELGKRSYYGYVLKLYYQNRLQDMVAKPRLLLDYAPATTLPQISDILFR